MISKRVILLHIYIPSDNTIIFLDVACGKCAINLDTATTDGLLATIPPSTQPLYTGKYVGAADVRIAASQA